MTPRGFWLNAKYITQENIRLTADNENNCQLQPWCTYVLRQCVIGHTHRFCCIKFFIYSFLTHASKHQWRDRNDHHQRPRAYNHSFHNLPADFGGHFPGQHHDHHPVHAHQRDHKDWGVHVGVAQVEQDFTHGFTEDPRLFGQVDDEEDGEGHEEAICTRQVKDEEGGDRALFDACHDAPDDEEVARDAHKEDQAEDQSTQDCGAVTAHSAVILVFEVFCVIGFEHARRRFDPKDERESQNLNISFIIKVKWVEIGISYCTGLGAMIELSIYVCLVLWLIIVFIVF